MGGRTYRNDAAGRRRADVEGGSRPGTPGRGRRVCVRVWVCRSLGLGGLFAASLLVALMTEPRADAPPLALSIAIAQTVELRPSPARSGTPSRPLRIGSEPDYPPFAMVDDAGRPIGFSVDLFRAVAEVMDLEVEFVVAPWSDILDRLRSGRLDALPFVGMLPDRDADLDFSVPVVQTKGAVFVRKGRTAIRTESDLAGRRVAVMKDDVGHVYARNQDWAWNLVAFPTLEAAFSCLETGPCEAVVAPRLQGLLLSRTEGLESVTLADIALDGFSLSYAFAVPAGQADLLATLNGGLAIAIADGTLGRLYQKWLPELTRPTGIPLAILLPYATAALAVVLILILTLYMRQRRATVLATARGVRLERQAGHLRALADRLDIERAKAERARAETDAVIRVMPDLFFRMDAEGRFVDCHDPDGMALAPREALLGRRYDEVLPADTSARIRTALDAMLRTREVQTLEYTLALPDDAGQRTFEAKLAPLEDGGALAVIREVTEARTRELQLSTAAMAIAGASAAKTRFLATMSHELRTPLNAVLGFTEVLSRELFGPLGNDTYRQYATDAHAAGQTLMSIIDDLMDISRIESGKLTLSESVVDVHAILQHKAALLHPMAQATDTAIVVAPPREPVRLWADEIQVQRMLVNLLSNAVKFTDHGRVDASIDREEDGAVVITIRDTGIGMTAEQLAHLGEPFYQASPAVARTAGGTGLGITLVKEMIALHGGALAHESTLGTGTTARLTFPAGRVLSPDVLPGPGVARHKGR